MKNFFLNIRMAALFAVMFGLFSCVEPVPEIPEEPDGPVVTPGETYLRASLASAGTDYVEITVETSGLDSLSYVKYEEVNESLSPVVIFRNGKHLKAESQAAVKIDGLLSGKQYYFYFAGKSGNEYFEDVVEVEATTDELKFTDLLTLTELGKRNYKVHITVPESVRNNDKRAIRYASTSVPLYLARKSMGMHDADLLYQNGQVHTREDITVDVNPDNEYLTDSNGELVIDPETGEPIQLHEPVVPGEPVIFTAAEFEWGEGYIANWGPNGDGWGYFVPLYDFDGYYGEDIEWSSVDTKGIVSDFVPYEDEHQYWQGAFQKLIFTLDQPDPMDAGVEIRYEEISPIDAIISLIPDDDVWAYCFYVLDDATYEGVIDMMGGREEWMQWFITSWFAAYTFGIPNVDGPVQFSVYNSFFLEPLPEQTDFHVIITALGNEDGTQQKYIHEKFTTAAKVLDPPVINVTAVEDGLNEYEAKFNIKAPNKDVVQAYYGANYLREWIPALNSGSTYASLVANPFSADDIAEINSDEGLTIVIPSLDGETTRIAVLGYNEEYTPNILTSDSPAVADCKTKLLDMVPHVDSPLFEELVGDWTMTATVWASEYDSNNNLQQYKKTSKTKVSIFNKIEVEELPDSVYTIYESFGWGKERVDSHYENYKEQAELFNNYRLHYRNRLLCLGWFEKDLYKDPSRLKTNSPFDLFIARDYQSYDNAEIFYDFGPKWFLEIGKDGSVKVPVNQDTNAPMSYVYDYVFFVSGYNHDQGTGFKTHEEGFPVEISADRNTIIIKSAMHQGAPHYMNATAGWGQADASIIEPVISEVKLTRGWTETKSSDVIGSSRRNYVEKVDMSTEDATRLVYKSMTDFPEPIEFKKVKANVITMEKMNKGLADYAAKYPLR